jgi:hypothetical protein
VPLLNGSPLNGKNKSSSKSILNLIQWLHLREAIKVREAVVSVQTQKKKIRFNAWLFLD